MPDTKTGQYLLQKIYDKVYGNGVPGMDQKLDKMSKSIEAIAKDNVNDHVLILRELATVKKEHIALKKKVEKHVKTSRFQNKIKHFGEDANKFVLWCKGFGNNVLQTIIMFVAIGTATGIGCHKQIGKAVNDQVTKMVITAEQQAGVNK